MFKKKVHRLTLIHKTFMGFLALWTFLIRKILVLWTFLVLTHIGQIKTFEPD